MTKQRRWYLENKEKARESNRRSYSKNKEKRRRHAHKMWKKNPHKHRELCNKRNLELKKEVLTHYGKKSTLMCCWKTCAITDVDMLSLDHVKNGGNKHREQTRTQGGASTYRLLIKEGFPEGYQTLCLNHQFKKALLVARRNRK